MNIQTAINELTIKDIHAIAEDDNYANAGDETTADYWCGMSVAYTGSIQLLEGALASANPDIETVIQTISERGENAKAGSTEQTHVSSRSHLKGVAAGSRDAVAHLTSALYASSH